VIRRAVRLARYQQQQALALRRMRRATGKPVIVYTIGKTGSSTVLATLAAALPGRPVWQIHHLQPERVDRSERSYRSMAKPIVTGHVVAARHMSRHHPPSPEAPWDVVTLVREPVAQDVSVFFQVGERRGFFAIDEHGELVDPTTVDELLVRFASWRDHEDDARWFDEDFEPSLGVDVYDTPFDPSVGFATYESERARVLLLRTEDLRRVGAAALGEFLGIDPPVLVDANVGDEKRYAEVYGAMRARGVDPALVDRLHATKQARHFYTADELADARARWVGTR
jgi:Putative capsular polysaccharide synthesis protein